jgi:hypothetical protein
MYFGVFRKPIDQAVGGKWDVKNVIVGTKEWGAIQLGPSMWLRKRSDETDFWDNVIRIRGG